MVVLHLGDSFAIGVTEWLRRLPSWLHICAFDNPEFIALPVYVFSEGIMRGLVFRLTLIAFGLVYFGTKFIPPLNPPFVKRLQFFGYIV